MYYKEWLEDLPPNISRHMRMLGFEACKTMIPFTRYVNERNDIGMRDWMQEHLSPSDFNYWQELSKKRRFANILIPSRSIRCLKNKRCVLNENIF